MRARWLAVAALAVWLAPGTAWGHAELVTADPQAGKQMKRAPDHLALGFTETPVEDASRVEVVDGCGETLALEDFYRTERTLHVFIGQLGHPGTWKVTYDVLSAEDGHAYGGKYSFKVQGTKDCSVPAGTGAEAPEDDAEPKDVPIEPDAAAFGDRGGDDGSSLPVLPAAVAALAIIGVAIIARGAAKG